MTALPSPNKWMIQFILVLGVICYSGQNALGQCSSINVDVDTSSSCAPGIFTFVVKNAPSGSLFQWDFGKGDIPGKDTFRFIEPDPQVIDLTLTVNFPSGNICSRTFKGIVKILAKPKPRMSISKKFYCNTDEVFELKDNTPGSAYRVWTIEGNNYGDSDRVYTGKFTSSGKKDIFLMVEDSFGCRGVTNFPEVAEVVENHKIHIKTGNPEVCVNSDVGYSVGGTLSATDIKRASWKFPGALTTTSSQLVPKVRYAKGGYYGAEVEVETKKGCIYTVTETNLVRVVDSVILDVAISDSILCLPEWENVKVKNKGLYGTIHWDVKGWEAVDTISPFQQSYAYRKPGVYPVYIEYTDSFCTSRYFGARDISAKQVIAHPRSNQHYDCQIPFLAVFTNGSTSSDPGKLSYRWIVYDTLGNILAADNKKDFQYLVKDSGYYDVELAVRHENGCGDTAYHTKFIRADSIRIDFVPIPQYVCLNQNVLINNHSLAGSYRVNDQYEWFLYKHGDTSSPIATSKSNAPTFNASYDGSYDLLVKASNSLGCKQELFREEAFETTKPRASFFARNDNICQEDTFSLVSTIDPQDGNFQHNWMLTNGKDTVIYTGGKEPVVELDEPGVYDIRYDVSIYGYCKDTIRYNKEVTVTGLESEVTLPSEQTCRGVDYIPEAKVMNYVYGGMDDTIFYEWRVFPDTGWSITNEGTSKPTIRFSQNGEYRMWMVASNVNGCTDTVFIDAIKVGLDPDFFFTDTAVCANTPIDFFNLTGPYANRWFYDLQPSANHQLKGLDKDTGSISIAKAGNYTLNIIASHDSLCFDTLQAPIQIVSPVAEFHALDSNLYCAPVYQRFRSTSLFADTLFWDFGDGNTLKTTSHKVTTVYLENTGNINPYTVRLIAKNKSGCSDTLVKEDMIKITGPAVVFDLDTNRGCEPFSIKLKGQTENVAKMFIDYGDGGPFGYNLKEPHTYYNKWRIVENQYKLTVLVVDKNGCQTAVRADDIIYVKPSPTARIGLTDSIACIPLSTRYFYLGEEAKTWSWDFDGDGTPDGNNASGNYQYKAPGRYQLTLTNINDFGCTDTAIKNVHAVGAPRIKIDLTGKPCVTKLINVTDATQLDTTMKSRLWTVDDGSGKTTHSDPSFNLARNNPAEIFVKLEVTDEIGCTGKDSTVIKIKDKDNSEPADMDVVSVAKDDVIELQSVAPSLPYRITEVFREDVTGIMQPHGTRSPTDINWYDTLTTVVGGPVCYEIRHLDSCDFASTVSNRHCTMFLTLTSAASGQQLLDWTPYIGWPSVLSYEIYRRQDADFELLASVDGNVTEYLDTMLCDFTYCYVIVAKHPNKVLESRSNEVCSKPIYLENTSESHIEYVSVVDNEYVEVKLKEDVFGRHIIEKWVDGTIVSSYEVSDLIYNDFNVKVDEASYRYLVKSIDHCNSIGETGRSGKSILLDASVANNITFNWTAYTEWETGVDRYEIHRQVGSNFVKYTTVSGEDTLLRSELTSDLGSSNCFKVIAFNDAEGLTSHSNVRCLEAKAIVFIPNAFTPFGSDELNNEFKPYALFIKSPINYPEGLYDFKIFNRWGELIYQTNDPEQGWDGTVNGKEAPASSYMYYFRVRGLDNEVLNYSGTVTLIR